MENTEKVSKNKKMIAVIMCVIIFAIGFLCGIVTGLSYKNNEKEEIKTLTSVMTKSEILNLKTTIEKDEADYGNNYQKFDYSPYVYKEIPDRIYFKSSKADVFYKFEKTDENYKHLLEVSEDRMHYSVIDDYNLNCFTPDSINKIVSSEENYIIFDYDNGDLNEMDSNYNKDLIFKFSANTRLFRLATYLSYYKEPIEKNNLEKKEFACNTKESGFSYMMYKND